MSNQVEVPTATRTLIAAGFEITHFARHPSHIEYECEREDAFGALVRYLIVISGDDAPSSDLQFAQREAKNSGRTLVVVAGLAGKGWITWNEFLSVLGGAVPTWRALDDSYAEAVRILARNQLPPGASGEAWRLFEDGVADGLEFVFGRRVKRMGGVQRFKALPDMLAMTPGELLMLVDAKASGDGIYRLERPKLRPLAEYVERQVSRQQGADRLRTALLVAAGFEPQDSIHAICNGFFSETALPLGLLEVETLVLLVSELRQDPPLRARVRWKHLFTRIGLISAQEVREELKAARSESWSRELRPEA